MNIDKFKEKIKRIFEIFNENTIAERIIQEIKQWKSVSDYTAVFMKYIDCIEWDDKVKQFIFKDKFKIKMFIKLIYYDAVIKNLNNLIKIIIKINDKLY